MLLTLFLFFALTHAPYLSLKAELLYLLYEPPKAVGIKTELLYLLYEPSGSRYKNFVKKGIELLSQTLIFLSLYLCI